MLDVKHHISIICVPLFKCYKLIYLLSKYIKFKRSNWSHFKSLLERCSRQVVKRSTIVVLSFNTLKESSISDDWVFFLHFIQNLLIYLPRVNHLLQNKSLLKLNSLRLLDGFYLFLWGFIFRSKTLISDNWHPIDWRDFVYGFWLLMELFEHVSVNGLFLRLKSS